jgi:hypothetical protein
MGVLIHKIKTENHDVIDEIEMFSLQMANEKVEFSAAEFFPINNTLIFSVRRSLYFRFESVFSFVADHWRCNHLHYNINTTIFYSLSLVEMFHKTGIVKKN